MPRPRKWRRVCKLPQTSQFGPWPAQNPDPPLVMSVDEYETIRLIDLEGFTQAQCADQMKVARTTVQSIYFSARQKLAASLVEGKTLRIEGGDYQLCEGLPSGCGPGCQRRRHSRRPGQGQGRGPRQGSGPQA